AAYADSYHAVCRTSPDGRREVLGKFLRWGRDFDRFLLMHRGYVPLAALMHRRDILGRVGGFDERLDVHVGWDFTRRLAFFTDFIHVARVTSEQDVADENIDPDAAGLEGDPAERRRQLAMIRSARPAKPWPRMFDLAVVLSADEAGEARRRIEDVRRGLLLPHRFVAALPPAEADRLSRSEADVTAVAVDAHLPWDARIDRALRSCEGRFAAVLPAAAAVAGPAIAQAAYVLFGRAAGGEAMLLARPGGRRWSALFRTAELLEARRRHPALSIRSSAEAAGIVIRRPRPDELPGRFDRAMLEARAAEADGNFAEAARLCRALRGGGADELWAAAAEAEFLGQDPARTDEAIEACRQVNRRRPTVASLLLEGRLLRRKQRNAQAADLLERARDILEWQPGRELPTC
ncbi:MAG: hypothetical protein J7M21_02880, partial [Planctomycetes bacterium]|nr:hypothetical protein [Planctomycetota bacterium]